MIHVVPHAPTIFRDVPASMAGRLPMQRLVEPELLDGLPADDPRAIRSRRDLRRINALMGNVRVLSSAIQETFIRKPPKRIADLGAGDGTLMLRLARNLPAQWRDVELVLVDRRAIISDETRCQFEALSWRVKFAAAEVTEWLTQSARDRMDLITANLFLHHFSETGLRQILTLAAERTDCFLACDPRRYPAAIRASRWLWLIGCSSVTRHDAAASIRAGFDRHELSALWPADGNWDVREAAVGLFSHRFQAHRRDGRANP